MKRLVIKTVVITIAAIVVLTTAAYFLTAFISPKTLADGWKSVGNYTFSVKYYEKQYQKTENIEDLANLCIILDVKGDNVRAVKYLKLLTEREDFVKYCENKDAEGGFKMTTYEYYYGRYTVATYWMKGIDSAVDIAKRVFGSNGKYTENNSFYILLTEVETLSKSEAEKISSEIAAIKVRLTDSTQREYAARDIEYANSIM